MEGKKSKCGKCGFKVRINNEIRKNKKIQKCKRCGAKQELL